VKSRHGERFNHDDDASFYDVQVRREGNPIRSGYGAVLRWVAEYSNALSGRVLELGSGTGNLTALLDSERPILCVDLSERMFEIAREKLAGRAGGIGYVREDLLGFFDNCDDVFGVIVSTYAVHHLEEDEKQRLFEAIRGVLQPGGVAIFGDLMFASERARREFVLECRGGERAWLADEVEDEYFWLVDRAVSALEELGFEVRTEQFSELSWGVRAELRL